MTLTAVLLLALSAEPEDAARLYEEAARHYQVEEYEAAIDLFKRSYVLSKNPGALYNIAQAYRFMGGCREAVRYYKLYLAEKPKAADRANVEALIAKLGDCPEKERAPEPLPSAPPPQLVQPLPPAPAPPPAPPTRWAPWAVTALGAVSAAAGLGLNIRERVHFASLQQQCPCPMTTWANEPALERASWGLLIAGAVVLIAGVVWLIAGAP